MRNLIAGTDNNNDVIPGNIEPSARAITISRALHNRIMLSNQWLASYYWGDVPTTGDRYLLLKVAATANAHISITIMTEAKAAWWLYETPTITDNGSAVDRISVNRQDPVASTMTVFRDTTITLLGTILETGMLGRSGKFNDMGGSAPSAGYWLLKKSTNYLFRIENMDDAAKDLVINVTWHEH